MTSSWVLPVVTLIESCISPPGCSFNLYDYIIFFLRLASSSRTAIGLFLAIFPLCSLPLAQCWCRVLHTCWRKECRPCFPHWNETPFCCSENQYVKIGPLEQRREEPQACCPSPLPSRKGRILFSKSKLSTGRGSCFSTRIQMLILFDLWLLLDLFKQLKWKRQLRKYNFNQGGYSLIIIKSSDSEV